MTFQDSPTHPAFKANIFIDWLNVKKNGGKQLSFDNLMALVRKRSGHVVRANIYLPLAEDGQIGLYDAMKKAGFRLVIIEDKWGNVNCDAKMAVDMVTQSRDVDCVYLLSNDADFVPAVEYLQSIGKRVLLIHGDNPSNRLRDSVDEWRHFSQLNLLLAR